MDMPFGDAEIEPRQASWRHASLFQYERLHLQASGPESSLDAPALSPPAVHDIETVGFEDPDSLPLAPCRPTNLDQERVCSLPTSAQDRPDPTTAQARSTSSHKTLFHFTLDQPGLQPTSTPNQPDPPITSARDQSDPVATVAQHTGSTSGQDRPSPRSADVDSQDSQRPSARSSPRSTDRSESVQERPLRPASAQSTPVHLWPM